MIIIYSNKVVQPIYFANQIEANEVSRKDTVPNWTPVVQNYRNKALFIILFIMLNLRLIHFDRKKFSFLLFRLLFFHFVCSSCTLFCLIIIRNYYFIAIIYIVSGVYIVIFRMVRGPLLLLALLLVTTFNLTWGRGAAVEVGGRGNSNSNSNSNSHGHSDGVGGEDGRFHGRDGVLSHAPASNSITSYSSSSSSSSFNLYKPTRVTLGNDRLRQNDFEILRGMKVAVLSNPTGVFADSLEHIVDSMAASSGLRLEAIFSPEHGFR